MANAIPPSSSAGFEPWELDLARVVVAAFIHEQDVFTANDREDLINECLVQWWRVRHRYSRDLGAAPQTYMRVVLRNRLRDLWEAQTAQKRGGIWKALSLDTQLDPLGDGGETRADTVPDEHANTETDANLGALQERLALVRFQLPRPAAELFDALLLDPNKAAVARRLGLSRAALYRRLQIIRACAEEQGLDEFLD